MDGQRSGRQLLGKRGKLEYGGRAAGLSERLQRRCDNPGGDGRWDIVFTTQQIDDLTIEGDVDFTQTGISASITADSLTIVGPFELTFGTGARLRTQSCPGG
ncbi:MAG: hypothetical protein IT449_01465 [Phycisphaerales bacterium]|nr:hypothetical protein [Phycisphaerales bacterium]